ncbi:neogenin-like [Oppia nitens]|uniref:neogenin-like n=1 Tax=Oppia nitens TaxID=1686743 RepID=UPI0023DAA8FB|nr:neogenin-like [Oppia nitens]
MIIMTIQVMVPKLVNTGLTLYLFTVISLTIVTNGNQLDANSGTDELLITTFTDIQNETPQNVTVESSGATSVIIRWEPPVKELTNPVTGYKIRYRIKGNKKVDTVTTDGNRRLYEITNLDKGVTYNVKIAAIMTNGTGPASEWLSVETFTNDLDETQVPDKPVNLRAKPNANAIFVSWAPPKNQNIIIRGYTIGWGVGFPDVYTKVLDGKQRSFTIDNLQASSEYVISLRAFNQVGDGQPIYETVKTLIESGPESSQLPMLPPVGLKAIVLSSTTIILYWTDTTLARNQVVTDNRRYLVRYTNNIHSNNPKYKYYNTTDLNCMIDDLKPNTQYEFAVKVAKNRRESTWSMSVLNTTQESAPSSPPRDLTVVVSTNDDPTVINLHWQPPKQPNGQITGYVIFYTTDNTQRDRDWVVEGVIGDKMTTVLKGLLPDSSYYFKIQARNNKGYGPLSSEVSFKTLQALPDSLGSRYNDGRNISTNTLYIIIGVISVISLLLLIVVGTLLCRSKNSAGVMNAMRKHKGYMAAATSPTSKGAAAKGKGGRELKPPDLWIHHNEALELKAMDKNDSMSSTPMQRNPQSMDIDVIENSKKSSTYNDSLYDDLNKDLKRSSSPIDSTIIVSGTSTTGRRTGRAKPISIPVEQNPTSNGVISLEPSTGLSRPLFPRTQFNSRAHVTLDSMDNTSGVNTSVHHLYDPVASPSLHMGVGSAANGPQLHTVSISCASNQVISNASPSVNNYSLGKRQSSHPLKSFSVPAPPPPPLSTPPPPTNANMVRPQFIQSPNKKTAINGIISSHKGINALTHNRTTEMLKKDELTPSYSTEELNQEMANLEGLMKDLSAITAKEFEC